MAPTDAKNAEPVVESPADCQKPSLRRALIGLRSAQVACAVAWIIVSALSTAVGAVIGREYDFWAVLALSLVILVMSCLTLALSITWLVYTVDPRRRRAAATGGFSPTSCVWYSCDMGWDIFLTVFWLIMFILSAMGRDIVSIVLSILMTALLASTAVISGNIKNSLRAQAQATLGSGVQMV